MSVLVTGATGFLGSALTLELLRRGTQVRVLVRDEQRARALFGQAVELIAGEITNPYSLGRAAEGVEVIYHLAGRLYHPGRPAELYYRTHVEGTRVLLACCQQQNRGRLRRLVYCSTTGVYGVTGATPACENTLCAPTNPYEQSKLAGEQLVREACEQDGLPVCIARPGLVYGPGDLHLLGLFSAIKRGVFRVIGGGRTLLHPIYIDDLTRALLLCAQHPRASARCYNLAGEHPVSVRALAANIARTLDRSLPAGSLPLWLAHLAADLCSLLPGLRGEGAPLTHSRVAFLTHSRIYDTRRARSELGFEPSLSLAEGLRRTTRWYREQGYL
ncbi:MAG TPA: NAD-dependent epimerase/dehydratase family protein [Ktedonobacteraceae bacterium]|jgi:nucleoside-diphosphate-sugar epimerase